MFYFKYSGDQNSRHPKSGLFPFWYSNGFIILNEEKLSISAQHYSITANRN
jgi:hypothetical protein